MRTAAQWLQDLTFDLEALETVRRNLKFRGAQGKFRASQYET
jgi:adenylosuccinate lyase